jgi:hypothetical protein
MVQVGVIRVKIELLAVPLPGYPSSQGDFPDQVNPCPIQQHSLSQRERTGQPELPGEGLDVEMKGEESIRVESIAGSARSRL